jgi:hypothetical protein
VGTPAILADGLRQTMKQSPVVFAFHGHGGNMKYAATQFA